MSAPKVDQTEHTNPDMTMFSGITRNEALKALGNGVVPTQAAHALRLMLHRIERTAA